eukprot:PhF_6_TR2179/c0_g1_i1/m.3573
MTSSDLHRNLVDRLIEENNKLRLALHTAWLKEYDMHQKQVEISQKAFRFQHWRKIFTPAQPTGVITCEMAVGTTGPLLGCRMGKGTSEITHVDTFGSSLGVQVGDHFESVTITVKVEDPTDAEIVQRLLEVTPRDAQLAVKVVRQGYTVTLNSDRVEQTNALF